jgi:hypothetical protein
VDKDDDNDDDDDAVLAPLDPRRCFAIRRTSLCLPNGGGIVTTGTPLSVSVAPGASAGETDTPTPPLLLLLLLLPPPPMESADAVRITCTVSAIPGPVGTVNTPPFSESKALMNLRFRIN